MRLLSPDDACVRVNVEVGEQRGYSGTTIDVTDPAHVKALREVGYTVGDVSPRPVRSRGFRCPDCSFRGWFRVCGRCGQVCDRD